MKSTKWLGLILIMASGLVYTLERGFSILSTSLVKAGFFAGQMTGEVPQVEVHGFFSNVYVPLLLLLGLIFLFMKEKRN